MDFPLILKLNSAPQVNYVIDCSLLRTWKNVKELTIYARSNGFNSNQIVLHTSNAEYRYRVRYRVRDEKKN